MRKIKLVNSKIIFLATLIVVPTLVLLIYVSGLNQHRSLYLNSLISTTIVSTVFLIFITTGLYKGWKLRDNYGNFLNKLGLWKFPSSTGLNVPDLDIVGDADGGIEGCVTGIITWIVIGLFGSLLLWLFGAVIWGGILVAAGILYWIIFRAFRLIFLNSAKCKNNIIKSISTAFFYTILYNSWIYCIIVLAHYFNK